MILSGVQLNKTFDKHKDLLLKAEGRLIRDRIQNGNSDKIENASQQLEHISNLLEHDQNVRPVKIMGVKTDSEFSAQILTILASTLLVIGQMLLEQESDN